MSALFPINSHIDWVVFKALFKIYWDWGYAYLHIINIYFVNVTYAPWLFVNSIASILNLHLIVIITLLWWFEGVEKNVNGWFKLVVKNENYWLHCRSRNQLLIKNAEWAPVKPIFISSLRWFSLLYYRIWCFNFTI